MTTEALQPSPESGTASGGADPAPVVRVRDLVREFDDGRVKALRGVTFDVPSGELLVLIGLSGSGKSTLLRHINGLVTPTSGEVEVLGQRVDQLKGGDLRALRRRVGFIFQQFHLVGRATALENVLTGALGRLRGPRYGVLTYPNRMRREAFEQLDRVGLADQAFQRADTLSGGQQQRVAIARTLFQQPEVVLADEPVASLDPESSHAVMEVLFSVCQEDGLTVLCSLHQVDLALGWADRMIGLRAGEIVLDQRAKGLSDADARNVYRRVDPGTAPAEDDAEPTHAPQTSAEAG